MIMIKLPGKKQFLITSAISLSLIGLAAVPAQADLTITTNQNNASVTYGTTAGITNNGDNLTIGTGGDINDSGNAAISLNGHTTGIITVNTGNSGTGIRASGGGGNDAINASGANDVLSSLVINSGIVTSDAANGTIILGGSGTTSVDNEGGSLTSTGTGSAISTNGGNTNNIALNVINKGTLSAGGNPTINLTDTDGGSSLTLNNSGTFSATGTNGIAVKIGSGGNTGSITNSGTMSSTGDVVFNLGGTTTIDNSSNMTSSGSTGGQATIVNSSAGTITSLTNTGTISDSGTNSAIYNNGGSIGTITNNGGMINVTASSTNPVINNAGGTIDVIHNTGNGSIGDTAHARSAISTEGTINTITNDAGSSIKGVNTGVQALTGGAIGTITNSGTITGNSDQGIYNEGAITTITNNTTGLINGGRAILNNTTGTIGTLDNAGTLTTGVNSTIETEGTITTLNNTGTISNSGNNSEIFLNGGTIGTLTNDGGTIASTAVSTNAAINNGGTITTLHNTGNGIIGDGTNDAQGIYTSGTLGTLTNDAGSTIIGSNIGIQGAGGTITTLTNAGSITGGDEGIENDATNTITTLHNSGSGLISGASSAIYSEGTIGAITNDASATMTSSEYTIRAAGASNITSITNSGTITTDSNGFSGISTEDTATIGTITNNSTGTISTNGIGGVAIYNGNAINSIVNDGLIVGVDAGSTGIRNDTGTIGTISNRGTISQTGGGAGGGIVNNDTITTLNNSGFIHGGTTVGVSNLGTITTLTNTGTIDGQSFAVINNGTITTFNNNNGQINAIDDETIYNTNGAVITSFTNNGGSITSQTFDAFDNFGTVHLDNTNGTISTLTGTAALYNDGTMSLNNTNGVISATSASAIYLDAPLTGTLVNTGGLITSSSSAGTLVANTDLGNQTISGGTISNTSNLNTATAVKITSSQSGIITFNGVHIIADGDTAGSGHGIAIAMNAGGTNIDLSLDSNTIIHGSIVDTGNDTLDIDSSAATTGNIILGSGSDNLIFNGGSIAGNIDMGGGTNQLSLNSDLTTQGTISTSGAINVLIDSPATLTVNNAVTLGAGTITINNGGALDLASANVTTTGQLSNNGTVTINNGRTLSVGSLNTASTGTINYNVLSSGTNISSGLLNTGTSAANLTNQNVGVSVILGGPITPSAQTLLATGTGAATLPTNSTVTDNSYLYNFSLVQGTGGNNNNIYLDTELAQPISTTATNSNNAGVANIILSDVGNSSDPAIQQIMYNLNNAPTRAALNRVFAATLPTIDNGAPVSAMSFTSQAFDVTDSQLSDIQLGISDIQTASGPESSGSAFRGLHVWMQGFGQHSNQGSENGIAGYNATIFGGAIGADSRNTSNNSVVGLSFAYGRAHVNSNNINNTDTDVNTYQLTAYGNHNLDNNYFVAGMASLGWDRNNSTRYDVGGVSGLNANSDYNSWQGAGRAEFGRNFYVGKAVLTPLASVDYVHYNADSYQEHGAGGANLHVNSANEDLLNLGIGARAQWNFKTANNWQIKPDIHASYQRNMLHNDSLDATASFAAGGATFSVQGLNPANSTFDFGTGVKLYNSNNWDFAATYDHTARSDYNANSGMLRAAYHF